MAYLDRGFGIEIECYLPQGGTALEAAAAITSRGIACNAEHYHHMTRPHWKIVTDGSLNDYSRGIEIVSPILHGVEGLDAINCVMGALNDYGCTVSRLCGLHVHVGVGDANIAFFKTMMKLYAVYEPVIDAFMPPSRRESRNAYCRSMTSVALPAIHGATDLHRLIALQTRHGNEARYHKLNLAAYHRHRTVEFRQHSGTLDADKARNWTILCLRMVVAAMIGLDIPTSAGATTMNRARQNTKTWQVGQMMMRPEGVTGPEAIAATGWPSISLPQQARLCGLNYTTQRIGRNVRYYAQTAQASTSLVITLDGLLDLLGCDPAERAYFTNRTASMSDVADPDMHMETASPIYGASVSLQYCRTIPTLSFSH